MYMQFQTKTWEFVHLPRVAPKQMCALAHLGSTRTEVTSKFKFLYIYSFCCVICDVINTSLNLQQNSVEKLCRLIFFMNFKLNCTGLCFMMSSNLVCFFLPWNFFANDRREEEEHLFIGILICTCLDHHDLTETFDRSIWGCHQPQGSAQLFIVW